jgi:hypothetical protein
MRHIKIAEDLLNVLLHQGRSMGSVILVNNAVGCTWAKVLR